MSLVKEGKSVIIGGHYVGQGTKMFATALEQGFQARDATVSVHSLADSSLMTRSLWSGLQAGYRVARYPGPVRKLFYSDARANAGLITSLANREFLGSLTREEQVVAVHGAFAVGTPRIYAAGDVHPDILGADEQTTALVPLPQTRETLQGMGSPKEIEVVGFMVPQVLQSEERAHARQGKFAIGEPDGEDPLRIAFLTTGQFAHMRYLHDNILEDPLIGKWIQEGRAQLAVYTYNSRSRAKDVYSHAEALHLQPSLSDRYVPAGEFGVQVFSNSDPLTAVNDSILAASDADLVVTELAERVGWPGAVPVIALVPDGHNRKKVSNTDWARAVGLIGPEIELVNLGDTLQRQLSNPGSRLRTHDETVGYVREEVAQTVPERESFNVFDGVKLIVERALAVTG